MLHVFHHFLTDMAQANYIILGICSTIERQRYIVMASLIGCAHTQNDPYERQIPCLSYIIYSMAANGLA